MKGCFEVLSILILFMAAMMAMSISAITLVCGIFLVIGNPSHVRTDMLLVSITISAFVIAMRLLIGRKNDAI